MKRFFACFLLGCAALAAQSPFPAPPTALPSHPFFIQNTWIIGGHGNWDFLTLDPVAERLYIAHGAEVQVVDVETGELVGAVKGLQEAHSIALDPSGDFGYVSDGPADEVAVFDRRSFAIVARIPTGPSPRAIALDPGSGLLVAVCAGSAPAQERPNRDLASGQRPQRQPARRQLNAEESRSILSIIDTQMRAPLAEILLKGRLGFARDDGSGSAYIAVADRGELARIDLAALGDDLRRSRPWREEPDRAGAENRQPVHLDWSDSAHPPPEGMHLRSFALAPQCTDPAALALDRKNMRAFVACGNTKLAVLNTRTGAIVTTLPTGRGAEAVGYDPDRDLIFVANGGGDGTLTIIRRDVNDSYAVIQNLPTRQQARTLAVNPSTGRVYLVTVIQVAKLGPPPLNGIGTLKVVPQDSSFQVLVVGN